MRKEGITSVWVGVFDSEEQLKSLLEREYDEDGDALPVELCEGLGLSKYEFDEDFEESSFRQEKTQSLSTLLEGHSFWERVLPRLEALVGPELPRLVNTVYMVSNYEHKAPEVRFRKGNAEMWFLGAVSYESGRRKLVE